MIYALIIAALNYTVEGKLMAAQDVIGYQSRAICEQQGAAIKAEILRNKADAVVVFQCVQLQRPVNS